MTSKVNVGIIGCGNISPVYFRACKWLEILNLVGCADLDKSRAESRAREFDTHAFDVEALLTHPDIQIIINLTIPKAHGEIGIAALEAGKSVYNEKPLALSREEAQRMLALAQAKGLRVGGAPDTFMGAGIQTCRKLIDEGAIGQPIAATAFMLCHGHESWHPNPEFYYQPGGGPMFDMGPYYLTALVTLIGPVRRVTGSARITFPERTITSQPKHGQKITVQVPTHVTGLLDFASGAIGTIVTSFDVWKHSMPCIEIYGSEGSLQVPDPNGFGGPVYLAKAGEAEWREVPLTHPYSRQSRGLGVADMAYAMQSGRPHRASGELTYHVLDIMHAIHEASAEGRHIQLQSTCERPVPLPTDIREGILDP
ncbi:MAG: Gfo/Idh/MocA family oxidoreductase [Thermoflexales bacterium]|nr:Gfo/Idh/MocA family oxidoreductase [Thermoflexales bacterium]MDW8351138.1 Gfo/Idh/MocA family oxidoreductase [Anaerolineae bacterium]